MNRESESPSRPEIIPIRKTIPARSELEETLTQTIGTFRHTLLLLRPVRHPGESRGLARTAVSDRDVHTRVHVRTVLDYVGQHRKVMLPRASTFEPAVRSCLDSGGCQMCGERLHAQTVSQRAEAISRRPP